MTLASLIFVYNIFLIMIYTCTTVLFLTLFIRTKKRSYLAVTSLFLFFILDNTLSYMAEFLGSDAEYYSSLIAEGSIFKTLILAVICFCYLFIKAELLLKKLPSRIDWTAYAIVLLCLLILPEINFSENILFYFLAEPFFLIYLCLSIIYYWSNHRVDQPELTARLFPFRYLLTATPLLAIAIMAEDTVVLLQLSPFAAMLNRIRERNLFEDILSLVFVGYALYVFLYLEKAKTEQSALEVSVPVPETTSLPYLPLNKLDLKGFSQEYALTKRESQVLKLLLEDKSNQEMQDVLVIAQGTVKNHIHNIYQKTNVSKRNQLLMLVSEFTIQSANAGSQPSSETQGSSNP